MKIQNILYFLAIYTILLSPIVAQTNGPPRHLFFEYGPIGNNGSGQTLIKNCSHWAAGIKIHGWREEKPFQFEINMDYRRISFSDYTNSKDAIGLAEMYLGPRLLISKTKPVYPTVSVLGGAFTNFDHTGGINALITAGIYYNFTKPMQDRNGVSLELTYRPVTISYNSFRIPGAIAIRIGIFI